MFFTTLSLYDVSNKGEQAHVFSGAFKNLLRCMLHFTVLQVTNSNG